MVQHRTMRCLISAVLISMSLMLCSCGGGKARYSAHVAVQENELKKMKQALDEKGLGKSGSFPTIAELKGTLAAPASEAGDLFLAETEEGMLLMLVKKTDAGVVATGIDASGKIVLDPHVKKRDLLHSSPAQ